MTVIVNSLFPGWQDSELDFH